MDKIKTVKIKNPDGSVSEESYTISVDAKDVDMANGKELQETIGTIDIDTDGNIAEQLENLNDNVDGLNIDIKKKAYYYSSVADMKADMKLKTGDIAVTLGYYSINDGGGSTYKITSTESATEYQEELENGLYATLIVGDYAFPEMYGAKGDMLNDDTNAIQLCINNAKQLELSSFINGNYLTTEPIIITGEKQKIFGKGIIKYTGNESAIKIHGLVNSDIELNTIDAPNGDGIEFYCSNGNDFNQYINFNINIIKAKNNCVKYIRDQGWTNEVRFYNTRITTYNYTSGENNNGFYIKGIRDEYLNGWKLYNIGFEGVNNAVFLDNNFTGNKYLEIEIVTPRISENFDYIVKTNGSANFQLIAGDKYIRTEHFDLSNKTTGSIIGNVVSANYGFISNVARIENGLILSADKSKSYAWGLQENPILDMRTSIETYITHFRMTSNKNYQLTLNKLYGYNGINEFDIDVQGTGASITIKDSNENVLVTIPKLLRATYHFYFRSDQNDLEYYVTYKNGTSSDETLITDSTITLTDCTNPGYYSHNGYRKMGYLTCVQMCVIPSAANFTIDGLPTYAGSGPVIGVACSNGNGNLTPGGKIQIYGATTGQETYISVTYFSNAL